MRLNALALILFLAVFFFWKSFQEPSVDRQDPEGLPNGAMVIDKLDPAPATPGVRFQLTPPKQNGEGRPIAEPNPLNTHGRLPVTTVMPGEDSLESASGFDGDVNTPALSKVQSEYEPSVRSYLTEEERVEMCRRTLGKLWTAYFRFQETNDGLEAFKHFVVMKELLGRLTHELEPLSVCGKFPMTHTERFSLHSKTFSKLSDDVESGRLVEDNVDSLRAVAGKMLFKLKSDLENLSDDMILIYEYPAALFNPFLNRI